MDMIYSDILSSIKTTEHARHLLSEIDILLESLFNTDNKAFEKALDSISAVNSEKLKEVLLKNNINLQNLTMIKDYLTGVKKDLQKLKTLKLSLAFEVSENTINNLFNWVLKNLKVGIILDIKTDKSLVGGTIIEFEGRYKDLTLKKKLEEVFASKREEILKTIH